MAGQVLAGSGEGPFHGHTLLVCPHVGRGEGAPWGLFCKGTNPILESPLKSPTS